ncbi:Uncharacterised protein [Mycobacteroides abscessus subsp. abscessus]|nr:Uncharacterised protein [Mycobacteroides abscessus subsp. abscessus]
MRLLAGSGVVAAYSWARVYFSRSDGSASGSSSSAGLTGSSTSSASSTTTSTPFRCASAMNSGVV